MKAFQLYCIIVFLSIPLKANAYKEDLILPQVIIQSIYKEKYNLPVIQHNFNLWKLGSFDEPYLPTFELHRVNLPTGIPQNVQYSWYTKIGFLGELPKHFGRKGKFEIAIKNFQKNKIQRATELFRELADSDGEKKDLSLLYLGWISVSSADWEDAFAFAEQIDPQNNLFLLQEQIYLKSYIFYSRQEYTSIENLIAQYLVKYPNKELGFKLTYTRLLALVNQEKHFQADEILRTFLPKTTYTPNYAEFIELAGVINFGLKRYKKSLKDYSEAIRLRPNQKVTPLLMLKKAWLEYILTNYLAAKLTVSNIPEKRVGLLSDELRYLKFLIYLKIEDWPNVVQSFSVFKLNSDWYQYAAYLMNLNRQYLSNYPSLLNDLLNVSYQVPDHGIHVALKEGNDWFEKNNFKESEKFFLIALALEPNGQVYDQIRFNLAVNYIKTSQYKSSINEFKELLNRPGLDNQIIYYHILYSLYALKQPEAFLRMEKNYKIGMLKKLLDKEILLMKAGSFLLINKANEAVKIFLQVWEASQDNQVFQHGMEVLYKSNQFSRLIKIMERNIGALNKPLLSFYLRSYLSLDKSQKALEILTRYKSLSHTLLWVEVWNANQKHQAIINKLEGLLTSSIDRKTRLVYYLNLANAYFNQKEYSKSKLQFYRALALSKQLDQKSLIYYNLLLTTKLTDNAATFFREANLILKKQLSIESRYRITQTVSAYYLEYKKYEDADKILTEYIDSYTFDLLKIKTKRLQILVDFKNYQRCFQLSSADISHSSTKDRIDSLIWAGRCGVEVGKLDWIIQEYEGIIESSYRKLERNLILSEAYYQSAKYAKSIKILNSIEPTTTNAILEKNIILSSSYLELNQWDTALASLGEARDFKEINKYNEALYLQIRIYEEKGDSTSAIRPLLRLLYSNDTDTKEKVNISLNLAGHYAQLEQWEEVESILNKVDLKVIENNPDLKKKLSSLKKQATQPILPIIIPKTDQEVELSSN